MPTHINGLSVKTGAWDTEEDGLLALWQAELGNRWVEGGSGGGAGGPRVGLERMGRPAPHSPAQKASCICPPPIGGPSPPLRPARRRRAGRALEHAAPTGGSRRPRPPPPNPSQVVCRGQEDPRPHRAAVRPALAPQGERAGGRWAGRRRWSGRSAAVGWCAPGAPPPAQFLTQSHIPSFPRPSGQPVHPQGQVGARGGRRAGRARGQARLGLGRDRPPGGGGGGWWVAGMGWLRAAAARRRRAGHPWAHRPRHPPPTPHPRFCSWRAAPTSSAWAAGAATWTPPSAATAGRPRRTGPWPPSSRHTGRAGRR